VEIEIRENEKW